MKTQNKHLEAITQRKGKKSSQLAYEVVNTKGWFGVSRKTCFRETGGLM